MVEPVDPFQRRVFDRFQMSPRTAAVDHFGLVKPDDRLGQGVGVSSQLRRPATIRADVSG